jgi:DNA polymerase-3 subunit alpha
VTGCIEHGLTPSRAETLWDNEILGFISYGFNKSHSVSYAINSYQCAFLYTYYPKQWIKACLECDPDLEKTINVVRSLGLNVTKPDVNTSSSNEWNISDDNTCIQPLISLKGIGDTAASELVHRRPEGGFKSLNDFFYKEDAWRWNKLTKKALEILIRMEAFQSLGDIGPDKTFKNHRHLEAALFEDDRFDKIKKGKIKLEEAAVLAPTDNWTITERMAIQKGIVGFYDKGLIVGKFLDTFDEFGIRAIDEAPDDQFKQKVWMVIEKIVNKVTVTNKIYLVVYASGLTEKQYIFKVWSNQIDKNDNTFEEGNVIICSLSHDDYGYSLYGPHKIVKVTK